MAINLQRNPDLLTIVYLNLQSIHFTIYTTNNHFIVRWIKQTIKPKIISSISTRKELWNIHQLAQHDFELFLLLYYENCPISHLLPYMDLRNDIERSKWLTLI